MTMQAKSTTLARSANLRKAMLTTTAAMLLTGTTPNMANTLSITCKAELGGVYAESLLKDSGSLTKLSAEEMATKRIEAMATTDEQYKNAWEKGIPVNMWNDEEYED